MTTDHSARSPTPDLDRVRKLQEEREERLAKAEYDRETRRLGIKTGPFNIEEN